MSQHLPLLEENKDCSNVSVLNKPFQFLDDVSPRGYFKRGATNHCCVIWTTITGISFLSIISGHIKCGFKGNVISW